MKINTLIAISISLVIVITNNLIGYYFPPNGILFTPIVLIVIALLIGLVCNEMKAIWKTILLAGLIGLHYVGTLLYAGGGHDNEGLGWIHLLLLIGFIPAYLILITGIITTRNDSRTNKWIATLLFPLLIWIHFLLFANIGLDKSY